MALPPYKSGFDLKEISKDQRDIDFQFFVVDKNSSTTRAKSSGAIVFCVYTAVVFMLVSSIGYFALQRSEPTHIEIFPCALNSFTEFHLEDVWNSPRYCPHAAYIFFLKTHKCASSTVQNILMRYGDEKNLSFLLPKDSNYIGHPEHFSRNLISDKQDGLAHFNILCHHLRFNANAIREVMPQTTVFISILRNPVSLFRSMYDYYNMSNTFNKSLEEFVQDEESMEKLSMNRIYDRLGKNQMLFDFGYDSNMDNETLTRSAIEEIDKTFHLIMIQELFDESLVLLKYRLCWSMSDIIYLKHNMRTKNVAEHKNDSFTQKIQNFNAADKMLYDYFFQKLNNIIDSFGRERMAREVADLRLWNDVWFNHCVKKMSVLNDNVPSDTKAFNSKVYSFILNDEPIAEICKHLATEELQYTEKLRTKQKELFNL